MLINQSVCENSLKLYKTKDKRKTKDERKAEVIPKREF
jgi:hypothetical protein